MLREVQVRFALLVAVALSAPCAHAAELPKYDPEETCRRIATSGPGVSRANFVSCIKDQQTGYDHVRTIWDKLEAEVQTHCLEAVRMVFPAGSYAQLDYCAKEELIAAEKAKTTKFQFR